MNITTGYFRNLGRAAVIATAGFISSEAFAQNPTNKQTEKQNVLKIEEPLEEKIRKLERSLVEQQREIALQRNEIESLNANKYAKHIPIAIYIIFSILALRSFTSKLKADTKALNAVFEKELEEGLGKLHAHTEEKLNDLLTFTREGITALEQRLRQEFGQDQNPLSQILGGLSKGLQGARLTSALHHVLSQLDDDFSKAVKEGNFGAAGGIDSIEDLHRFLNDQSELFKEYATYSDEERQNIPIISFGKAITTRNTEHDEGDLPGNETQSTNLILIPTSFQNDSNLYIALLAREFSRVIHAPEEGYKTLAESQVNAFEKEIELIENVILLLNKIESGATFSDLNEIFNFEIEEVNFEGFKGFLERLNLDPKTLKEIIDKHQKELEGWRAVQKKA